MSKTVVRQHEIKKWLLSTLKHSCHVEYFLEKLGLGNCDLERPHDLFGLGNKFEWEVIKGMALQYRNPKVNFETFILPAIEIHRQQYHHRKWNNPDPKNPNKRAVDASEDDMLLGAVDAVCSLLENRAYYGGNHSYDVILKDILNNNPPHKIPWIRFVIVHKMRNFEQPKVELITDIINFSNIGLPESIYQKIAERMNETIETLRTDHNIFLD